MAKGDQTEFKALVKRTNQPKVDDKTLAELNEFLDRDPLTVQVIGNPTRHLRQSLVSDMGKGSVMLKQATLKNLELLEEEFGGKTATGAERLLIDNILTCWTWLQRTEARAHAALDNNHSFAEGRYWQDALDKAHGRFNRAVQSLASYRKVAINIQVNIAGQQINAQTVNTGKSE